MKIDCKTPNNLPTWSIKQILRNIFFLIFEKNEHDMFSKINKQDFYLRDFSKYSSYCDLKGNHLSQLFPVVTKHCPFKEHMAYIFTSQGKTATCTNQLKFAFHFVATDSGNSC